MTHKSSLPGWQDRSIVIKTNAEIALMQTAGQINALALAEVGKLIQPGVMTAALDKRAEEIIRDHGATPAFKGYPGPYPYPATINTSINEELVHGIPGKRRLQSGDLVTIDCGTRYQGYYADSAITFAVGRVSPEALRLIEVTRQALALGIEKLLPGSHLGDVSAAIQACVEGQGYYLTRQYTGHGIGREMHEGPSVLNVGTAGRGIALRPGMVIALEPMVLVGTDQTRVLEDQWTVVSAIGALTADFEHTVAVTASGPLVLTEVRPERIPDGNSLSEEKRPAA